jgi:hypothetical protein
VCSGGAICLSRRRVSCVRLRRRGGIVGQSRFQLGFDLNEILGLGLEVARMRPLETRLQHASDPPIGIAEVIVDGRILGLELDGALEPA